MAESIQPKFTVGIDLGTSNCAVGFASLGSDAAKVSDFPIPQSLREGQTGEQALLPSALYSPIESERSFAAMGGDNVEWIAGQYARWRGSKVPGRLITSAKSWLCHPAVDRTAGILPWGGAPDVRKISPVQASALLLGHLRAAWNQKHPANPLEAQEVVITVPASFDEVARSLTVNAARQAGLEHFTLVEEPQAAFYHFSQRNQRDLPQILESIRLVLVADVGGGTTDFSLIQVAASPEGPMMKRIAVGEHLILGGDNMDNAVARRLEEKANRKLNAAQWIQAVQSAREAKENLLGNDAPNDFRITIAGEGSKLLGSTISATLARDEIEMLVLDGFFPNTVPTDFPKTSRVTGIQEMGLPYVPEPAITRHLAAFLRRHAQASFEALGLPSDSAGLPRPDAVLLNGGVFNSPRLAERFVEAVSNWWPDQPRIPTLEHANLDLAVARGAAYYGLVRHGRGRRISGGTAHSFYLGVAAEKGDTTSSAICLIPRGMEEGEAVELKDRTFKLHLGRPVQFPIYTSSEDQVDRPGDVVRVGEGFNALPSIQTVLRSNKERAERIPVFLRGRLTEIGTVELWCAAVESNDQWRLEFDIRGTQSQSETISVTESLPPRFAEAKEYIAKIFGNRPSAIAKGPKDVKQLWAGLEQLLGARDSWPLAVLRQLWGELYAGAGKRRRSAEHEKIFFQLLGYTLRPGFGYSLDVWRCEQTFKLFPERIEFHKEKPNWNEF
ncbi:MAG TPA: Hsp70 family protein, partial [Candidatus Kapabacteria bacterium]|nr:Hsp70 family protein [Candidatus Kapabacteria bacterium]